MGHNAPTAEGPPPSRLLGAAGGALLAGTVLVFSFLVGKLDIGAFIRSALSIAAAGGVGAFVATEFHRHHLTSLYLPDASAGLPQLPAAVDPAVLTRLDDAIGRMEHVLERDVARIAGRPDIPDSDLADLEQAPQTREVVICRQKMGCELEADDPSARLFERVVESNLSRGVHYCWVSENNGLSRQRAETVRKRFSSHQDLISIFLVDAGDWRKLPFSFEAVFYEQVDAKAVRRVLGYADVGFGVDDVRSWRKVGPECCAEWFDQVAQVRQNAATT